MKYIKYVAAEPNIVNSEREKLFLEISILLITLKSLDLNVLYLLISES